ncbi:MAG: precorrin-6A reductase, partial [Firmicutes bacterium]|nr:precorrin-6A reductase [Bacillota bacterium]
MYNICIFSGTTEGRKLAEFLSEQQINTTACVATEYGEALIKPSGKLTVLTERLSEDEMEKLFLKSKYDLVIDATHPYATEVTKNIVSACKKTNTEHIRLIRSTSSVSSETVFVSDADEAAEYLNTTEGNILLTTGSKDIIKYTRIHGFDERLYARVLPNKESLEACIDAGINPSHIICMQGPFSEEMNIAMLKGASAKYLVTKDGGSVGGFDAKICAAKDTGVQTVVIGRPEKEEGLSFSDVIDLLCKKYGLQYKPCVYVIGIGPGSDDCMTVKAKNMIATADCLIGAKRMVENIALPGQTVFEAIDPQKIADFILSRREYRTFAVLLSGDAGFYSGAKKLLPLISGCETHILPGISSLVYLCSRIHRSYEDVKPVSLHGRDPDIVSYVKKESKVFALAGGENDVSNILCRLVAAGLANVSVYIGERLSYSDEKITHGTAKELARGVYDKLSCILIENEHPESIISFGLSDDLFMRNTETEKRVPMTKSEVRAVCLSKLKLTGNAVCWDIGAGTGSVSAEMALAAENGKVYAVEYKENAIKLLKQNAESFSLANVIITEGRAPDVCKTLPSPTHAFIGGSSGSMNEIIDLLTKKNPSVRIVATAVSLETIAELNECMKGFDNAEVVSIAVTRGKNVGGHNMMIA